MRVAYLGNFPFPGATAATHRVRGVAEALAIAGHEVTIVPLVEGEPTDGESAHVDTSIARRAVSGTMTNAAELLLGGRRAVAWLRGHRHDFDVALVYGTPAALLARYAWAVRRDRAALPPLMLDVVEWYDYSSRPGGRFGPFALEHSVAMNFIATRADSVMCISTFLAEHFAEHGRPVAVVPPLFGTAPTPPAVWTGLDPGRTQIGYAGSPGAKDGSGLANLVAAAAVLPDSLRSRVQVQIAGLTEAQGSALLRSQLRGFEHDVSDIVRWHGRLPASGAQALVAACDFTYLQRPRARYAMAGFPTKVVESLVLGTPVIVNATSDLATYVTDGENGVLMDQPDLDGAGTQAVPPALERVLDPSFRLGLSREQIRARAADDFGPAKYAEALDRLVTAASLSVRSPRDG